MDKENIYVLIDTEEKRLRALEILENSQEEILHGSMLNFKVSPRYKYLICDSSTNNWLMSISTKDRKNITLDQLDQLLDPNYHVKEIIIPMDELKSQANALGYDLVEKKREPKIGDFGVFWISDKINEHVILYDFLSEIEKGKFVDMDGNVWDNFRHLTDEEKTLIQKSW